MEEFRCTDVGAACGGRVTATNKDDLERQMRQHLREVHHVEPNETILTYLATAVRHEGGGSR
jgi:predicted small metal-binding protein